MTATPEQLREHALSIFHAAVEAVQPENCIPSFVRRRLNSIEIQSNSYPLDQYEDIYVIAFGKAASGMFRALFNILQDDVSRAIILDPEVPVGHETIQDDRIQYYQGTHPLPSEKNREAAEAILDLCQSASDRDLIFFLISGGGSSLLFAPSKNVPLDGYKHLTEDLMKAGLTIHELNTVRTALSRVKGGQLLSQTDGADVVNLIISDVIGDPVEFIASGPTVFPDVDSMDQLRMRAKSILEQNGLFRKNSDWLAPALEEGYPATHAKEPDTHIVGSNRLALSAAKRKANDIGYNTIILSSMLEGESRNIGHLLGTVLLETIESGNPLEPPCCILSGGETTVTVRGEGKGGRNQELALGAADILRDAGAGLLLSAGTDGIDGPTDAAGAIVDSTTAFRAVREGLSIADTLRENDSYYFFNILDDLVLTGPTGTNVMDIQIGLME
ncbi:MAG: DUF4147 domain-containing protein [Candidatus Marinimicrobia bacterium]|nr:DUF4147 domain-containing protein [Candidatus Neomarinimicrobiota bacterium]MCF7830297.1 DUF4147 domain-containing protein [Candidatus Neomarinimicrobiota bacterium]MCF7882438.1 DUF4147 domain-containing protein [Candidatus Neomarinimicrobiota bacterium]